MASTWSNLGINLQGTGDNSGTWGQLTNVNLQDFDYAISGVAAITLTGNTTLAFTTNSSSTTYSNESGRAAVLVLSGSLSATTVTVTVPNIQKNYVIINNSGATATISAGGSTTVSLGTSTSAYVYSNGSSSIFTAITSNPGGTTNQVQYNNAGAFAGSTNLTFNGTTLAMQTATALNLTATSLTATNATITTDNITTANITTANVTSLTAVTATTTTENVGNINLISNGTLKIYNTANSQYTGLKIAAGATTTATFTLPSADGTSGQFLKTNGSGVLSFGAASAITWQSVQTTNFTAVAGNGYPVNTTSAGITVTLPVSASTGDTIQIVDYAGTFNSNNLTINPNGLNINGSTNNTFINSNREGVQLTYVDSTQGWVAVLAANEGTSALKLPYTASYLIVAGGGGSGGNSSGGGGAGGFLNSTTNLTPGTTYTITVGGGGAGGPASPTTSGSNGSNSSITGLTSAVGGGGGGSYGANGISGGSGGGGGTLEASPSGSTGGSGTAGQGNAGGNGGKGSFSSYTAGGGGGANATGGNFTPSSGGNGGSGSTTSIITTTIASGQSVGQVVSSSVYFSGGGGGGAYAPGGATAGSGGNGGGANGSATASAAGTAGTANTGGGAGGAAAGGPGNNGASGGSGVVILSVPTANYSGTYTGSSTYVTTNGTSTVIIFKSSGSYTG